MARPARFVRAALAATLLLGVLAGCGDDDDEDAGGPDTAPTTAAEAQPEETTTTGADQRARGAVEIRAEELAFDPTRVEVAAGDVTITFRNLDASIPHNLHVKAPGDPKTEVEEGMTTQTLELSVAAGTYEYVCDVHPDMTGSLVAT